MKKYIVLFLGLSMALLGYSHYMEVQAATPKILENILASREQLKKLYGQIPGAVAHAKDLGKTSDTQVIPITVSLELNHTSELTQELSGLYEPGNPNFGKFLTPEEFHAKYSPSQAQVADVQSYLKTQGFTSISADPNGFLIHAMSSISSINAAFHTEIHQFMDASGVVFHSPFYEIQVPLELAIQAVHGLENHTQWQKNIIHSKTVHSALQGTGPGDGLSPLDIRTAYNIPTQVTGKGQSIALFELDAYLDSDVKEYESHFKLPPSQVKAIAVDDADGSLGAGADEVILDIELIMAVAPGAEILVYEGPRNTTDQQYLDTFAKIANDNLAKIVSTSWGIRENESTAAIIKSENAIFMQMAAQGQSVYAASGDTGAYAKGLNLLGTGMFGQPKDIGVQDPSSQPYVVGVGGTTLKMGKDSSYKSESTWGSGGKKLFGILIGPYQGGGGGISKMWAQPSWQKKILLPASTLASSAMRNVPDVALNADPNSGYSIYLNSSWGIVGGTSAAAPIWAAFTALVNERRVEKGLHVLGFPNPILYQIGTSHRYANDFHDIADGTTNLHYPAVKGYDDATGWGSFNGENLFQDLTQ